MLVLKSLDLVRKWQEYMQILLLGKQDGMMVSTSIGNTNWYVRFGYSNITQVTLACFKRSRLHAVEHIRAPPKWPTFCKRYFHMDLLQWILLYIIQKSKCTLNNTNSRLSKSNNEPKISDGYQHLINHDDVINWKQFPRYWPFVREIHLPPLNFLYKGQWPWTLMFSLICAWIYSWVNNREAGHLMRHRAHYDVIVMRYGLHSLSETSCITLSDIHEQTVSIFHRMRYIYLQRYAKLAKVIALLL